MPIVGVLNPALLALGLACVAIPILVHLLRRRHRPVEWGAMRFLEQAYRKRRRRVTLEQLLLLLTRCALVTAIAIGVGSLLIGSGRGAPVSLVIAIDDSIHAQDQIDGEPVFEIARRRADAALAALDPARGDRAALVTLGAPARALATPETSDIGFVRQALARLSPTDAARDPQGAARLITQLDRSASGAPRTLAIVTGGRGWSPGAWDGAPEGVDRVLIDVIGDAQSAPPNAAITGATSLTPLLTGEASMTHAVRVTVERDDAARSHTMRVRLFDHDENEQLGAATLAMGTGERTRSVAVSFAPPARVRGALVLRAQIEHDGGDRNPADDARLLGLASRDTIRVGVIDTYTRGTDEGIRPSRWVRAALDASEDLIEPIAIDAGAAATRLDPRLDALVVLTPGALSDDAWDRVLGLRDAGASVIVTPDRSGASETFAARVASLIPGIDPDALVRVRELDAPARIVTQGAEHDLIAGIRAELPALAAPVRIDRIAQIPDPPEGSVVLATSAGAALVVAGPAPDAPGDPGRGVVLAAALDEAWTDLPARPLFVALMHEILRRGVGASIAPRTVAAGASDEERTLGARRDDGTLTIINPDARDTARPSSAFVEPGAALGAGEPVAKDAPIDPRAGLGERSPLGPAPFVIALALAVIEFVLARRCSFKGIRVRSQGAPA